MKFFNIAFDPTTQKPIEVEAADGFYAHSADVVELKNKYEALVRATTATAQIIRSEERDETE